MQDQSGTNMLKKIILNPLTLLLLSVACFLFIATQKKDVKKIDQTLEHKEKLKQEINSIENEIADYQNKLSPEHEKKVIETIMRDELLMQKDDETIIQLPPVTLQPTKPVTSPTKSPKDEWLELLF